MHEKLQVIFNRWCGYSDGKEWLIEEDREAINISYFNFQGSKLFTARLTRTENPSDEADVTYTLYYWGQAWNAIFACQEKRLLQEPVGMDHIKTLINLVSYELSQNATQDFTGVPRFEKAILAYRKDNKVGRNAIWLCSDDTSSPLPPKMVERDFQEGDGVLSRIKRLF